MRVDVPNVDRAQSLNLNHFGGDQPGAPGGGNTPREGWSGTPISAGTVSGWVGSMGVCAGAGSPGCTRVHWFRSLLPRVQLAIKAAIAKLPRILTTQRTRALW
jgi:hypothetical protein